jgi:hypothetical protein
MFFRDPALFNELKVLRVSWLNGAYFTASLIGFGVLVYSAAISFLSWMPRSWVEITEDGRREWIGYSIAAFVGMIGAGLSPANSSKNG